MKKNSLILEKFHHFIPPSKKNYQMNLYQYRKRLIISKYIDSNLEYHITFTNQKKCLTTRKPKQKSGESYYAFNQEKKYR